MIKTKSEKFFKYIWTHHGKRIYYFIAQTLPAEKGEYDDIFQEVMMKIYSAIESYNNEYSINTWIYRIARNCCIDYMRKKSNRSFIENSADIDNYSDPERSTESEGYEIIIEQALNVLEGDDRQIAYLRFQEELSFKEVSIVMGININTVKTRITKIKRILMEEIKKKL